MTSAMDILIGTPAYGGMVHIDYLSSVLSYHTANIPITVINIGNESLITRARNTIISFFYHNKRFTHLLWLDADIGFHASELLKLIDANKDVIGAPCKLKGTYDDGSPVYNVGKMLSPPHLIYQAVIETEHIGNAVLMFSRNVVETLVEDAKKNGDIYVGNPLTRGDKINTEHYDIFKVGVYDGVYLSEDYYVCRKLRELGFHIWCDQTTKTVHNGNYAF